MFEGKKVVVCGEVCQTKRADIKFCNQLLLTAPSTSAKSTIAQVCRMSNEDGGFQADVGVPE
jgi:hypothetical protein